MIDICNLTMEDVSSLRGITKPQVKCPDCGDEYEAGELTTVFQGGNRIKVCQTCIDTDYILCEGCRNYIHRDDFYENDEICEECCKRERRADDDALYWETMERRFEERRLEGGWLL